MSLCNVCPSSAGSLSTAVSTSPAPHSPGTRAVTRARVPAGRRQPVSAAPGGPSWHRLAGRCTGEGLSSLPSPTSFPSEDNSAAPPMEGRRGRPWPRQPSSAQREGLASQTRAAGVEGHLQKCVKMLTHYSWETNEMLQSLQRRSQRTKQGVGWGRGGVTAWWGAPLGDGMSWN